MAAAGSSRGAINEKGRREAGLSVEIVISGEHDLT